MTMTLDDYARWRFERKLIGDLLDRVEQTERAILRSFGCPTDPVSIYEILNGERPAPWPARTAERTKTRARHAMHALVRAQQARNHLAPGRENARLAAHEALWTGLLAGDAALNAATAMQDDKKNCKGGKARGRVISREATRHDKEIAKLLQRWKMSEELQDQYPRSPVAYVRHKTGLHTRAIQRAVRRLTRQ